MHPQKHKLTSIVIDLMQDQWIIIDLKIFPAEPSPPQSLTVELLDSHSVYINWAPPLMPNGTIIRYQVEVQANSYNQDQILAGRHVSTDSCSNREYLHSEYVHTGIDKPFSPM